MRKSLALVVRIGSEFAASASCSLHPCPQHIAFFPLDRWSWVVQTLLPLVYCKRIGLPVGHLRTTNMPLEPLCGIHRSALYLLSHHSFSHEDNQANSLLPYSLLSLVATPRIKMTRMCGEKIHRQRPSYGSCPPRWALDTDKRRPATVSSLLCVLILFYHPRPKSRHLANVLQHLSSVRVSPRDGFHFDPY